LPAGWRGADVSAGVQGAASVLFPDDPSAAASIEPRLTVLPRAIVLFGVRLTPGASSPTFVDNVNVLPDPTAPPNLALEQIGPAEARGIGQFATITSQDIVDLGARKAYRIVYNTATVSGVAYIIKGTSDTWVVTYTFGAPTADIDVAESSAMTFDAP
jgi:hypothetical protein